MEHSERSLGHGFPTIAGIFLGLGLGGFLDGIVLHQVLGLHHVNEKVPPDQWIYWDLGFLACGALMVAGGWLLLRAGKRDTAARSVPVK